MRILLILIDNVDNLVALQELNKIAFTNNFTLISCWSYAECARYLETFKLYEGKAATAIQEKEETEFLPRLNKVLTNVKSVNKTDVVTLLDVFGSFRKICQAKEGQLVHCPGLGEKKVKRLHQVINEPFIKRIKRVETDMPSIEPVESVTVDEIVQVEEEVEGDRS